MPAAAVAQARGQGMGAGEAGEQRTGGDHRRGVLPALHAPTVNPLGDPSWVAIETVVDESIVREIIPQLKAAGASGIIELALNKVVP